MALISSYRSVAKRSHRTTGTMYPKVKVRGEEEEHDDPLRLQEEKNSLLLRIFESISLQNHCTPGNEYCNISPPHARIPKSYVPNVPMPSVAISKDITHRSPGKNNEETDEKSRTHIRASPVPRPRAVLSSPDNDGMVGSRNRLSRERDPLSTAHNSGQNKLVQGNQVLKNVNTDGPVRTTRVSKEADSMTSPKEKHTAKLTTPRQKSSLRKAKASNGSL
ncbi:hypothetical protein MRB53_026359 [Persea americana]|uniref:Uncharacterized protein n=1 Tax=Persea americana TaxID=3435 RepID=A0ACC2LI54_PERAE|nr:hypothetical protein MRB53_026359 [Persea americana]